MRKHRKSIFLTALAIFFLIQSLLFSQDTTETIDANRITMFAGNNGILSNDFFREINEDFYGFYYQADTTKSVIWASGLWMAASVRGGIRTGMAYYSSGATYTEFSPGPYKSDITDSTKFKVYKITRDDLTNPGDVWINWPVDLGAPVDSAGNPLLLGDQTLFSVYNDADTSRRDFAAGSREPLGAEVRQLVYAYDKEKYLGDAVFVDLEIINRSETTWDSLFIGLWADPDIGRPDNDLVGSYQPGSMIYGYSDKLDQEFENFGQAAAGVITLGAKAGHTDYYDPYLASHTNPVPFFPITPEQSYYYVQGLDSAGNIYVDPTTSDTTRFIFDGDPRYNVGWLDQVPDDKKTVVSSGPYRLRPGQSVTVSFAYVAQTSIDMKTTFDNLFELSEKVVDWHNYGAAGFEMRSEPSDGFISKVEFMPDYQNWMYGIPYSGDYGGTGIGKASAFFGSSVEDSNLYSVELQFSYDSTQKAHYYTNTSEGWHYQGFIEIPVRAYASRNNDQLDLIYLSEDGDDCDLCFINPRGNPQSSYNLIITGSLYTGEEDDNFIFENPLSELGDSELLYLIRFRPKQKALVHNIQEGQKLVIVYSKDMESSPTNLRFGINTVSIQNRRPIYVNSNYNSAVSFKTELSNPRDFSFEAVEYTIDGKSGMPVYLQFHPEDIGLKYCTIKFYNTDFEEYYDSATVNGRAVMWPVDGDINLNGWLEPSDLASYIGYLYDDYALPETAVELDLDNSGNIDIADIVHLINILFISPNL
jgi:hypothetical protein